MNINILLIHSVEMLGDFICKLKSADKLYIVSYTRAIEILHWIWEHNLFAESIYDVLEQNHIYLQMEFYRFFTPLKMSPELGLDKNMEEESMDGSSLILYEYYYQKQRLLHSVCDRSKRIFKEKLFFLAICMKNFLEAENILNTMASANDFEKCWNEIQQMFCKVKKILSLKQEDNIIIYWIDAMSYEESKEINYLESRRNHALYFQRAYAETPYTNAVSRSMFCKLRQVDDLGYRINHIDSNNSPLLQDIVEQGYNFSVVSAYLSRLFDSKYNHCIGTTKKDTCSEVFWNLLSQILLSEQETVYLTHALMELHRPYLSVRRAKFESQYDRVSRKAQMEEIDAQLRFYDEMLGDKFYRIYMSDHGFGNDVRRKTHIHFQVYHSMWMGRKTDKLFCFLDFSKIMHQLLSGKEIDDSTWNREYIPIQDVDHYNREDLKGILKGNGNLLSFITYKGAITEEGIYLHFKTGDELFNNWSENIIDVQVYLDSEKATSGFCKELREKVGGFPRELDMDSKFRYAIYTYKAYDNVKKTIRELARLLNQKFSVYANKSIVLRMGGEHSWQLYGMLTEANRKKIGGVIDRDERCSCKNLGVQIFLPGAPLPNDIEAILLSSYIFSKELRKEAKEFYSELEIIDIYRYWEEAGYHFYREFWFGLDTDYEVGFLEN